MRQLDLYPNAPGHNHRPTSIAAAQEIAPHVTRLAETVLEAVRARPMNCWEIEQATGLSHQTASARLRELYLKGRIEESGQTRPTGSGRQAIVWKSRESK